VLESSQYHGVYKYPILKKAWQPEEGKYYKFWNAWDNESRGVIRRFAGMQCGMYLDNTASRWVKCAPIDPEELGK